MDGLHNNMEREFEADNLSMFFDCNDDHFVPTFLQSEGPHSAVQDLNLMESFNFQTDLPPVAPSAVVESINEAQAQTHVQLMDPTSWFPQGPSSEMTFTFVPNPIPPSLPNTSLLNGTQPGQPLSTMEGLMLDGMGPCTLGQDMTQAGYSNQFSDLPNENSLGLQGIHFYKEILSNQPSIPNTLEINNFNAINIIHSSPKPALIHPNPVQAGPGNETYSSGLFVPPERSVLEPYANIDPGFVTIPPNPNEQGCRPVLPEPAVPSATSLANNGPQSSFFATSNSYGSRSSVTPSNEMFGLNFPIWHFPLYANQDQHQHPQVMTPNDQGQQSSASMQQCTSSHSTTGSRSRVSNSRKAKIAPNLRVQEEAAIPKNEVPACRDKGNLMGTSSTRSQPSEAIRRILNMNPSRLVSSFTAEQIQSKQQIGTQVRYQPPSPGRPSKRSYKESYFQREKWPMVSSGIGNSVTTPATSQHTPGSVLIKDRNAIPTNHPFPPRQFVNSVYDIEYERKGHPIDPHLRLFKSPPVLQMSAA
ncbi:unnamed protein product [Sphenostylis stenocarpa]|uniref:Uncharacterized protein n=1 Tax=Sphenostylis stenocarpa TaxID=92480 RepID=A0AA86THF2_9FABA|nr:unnamed protein product [Sphenostylis stenocarpa]